MNFERMRDVINHARDFHRELSAHFKSLNDDEQQDRVRMLLDYLSRHEENMAKVLEDFEKNASPKVLDTWFQYTSRVNAEAEKLKPHSNLSFEEVVDRATRFDQCLVDMYKTLAWEAGPPEIREVCEKLLQLEEEERHGRTRSINGLDRDM